MANWQHVKKLKQEGVNLWNWWRITNPKITPRLAMANLRGMDLRKVNLSGADLHEAKLSGVNLSGANLNEANLSGADLSAANLSKVNLSKVNLSKANLSSADLSKTDLRRANLSGADLSGADLNKTDLHKANLNGANLIKTNLFGTDLSEANLSRANLQGSNLSEIGKDEASLFGTNLGKARLIEANLRETNLSRVNLNGANLSGADLSRANLVNTYLNETNLDQATLSDTTIAKVDLRTTKGLTTIRHIGPSHIELFSVLLPQDGSALHFLRGVGTPDEWIDHWRISMMHPIQYYSCFISYCSKDGLLASRLHADLQAEGVRCWFAPEDMKIGDRIHQRIDEAIHLQDKLLLLLSEYSINSEWVADEVNAAIEKEARQKRDVLFPIQLDASVMETSQAWAAKLRRSRHIGDFTKWREPETYQSALERLLRDLKQEDH